MRCRKSDISGKITLFRPKLPSTAETISFGPFRLSAEISHFRISSFGSGRNPFGWSLLTILPGLNIQHDANHGAISKNPWVNRLLGLTENWIGGSQINWIHQHVVQHHIHTNDVHLDPDMQVQFIKGSPVRYFGIRKLCFTCSMVNKRHSRDMKF